jgi:anaerobic magnesium-protoporphyrin IX monomethyl ester cyclase
VNAEAIHRTADAGATLSAHAHGGPGPPRRRTFVEPLNAMTVAEALERFPGRAGETVKILRPPAIFSASSYSTPLAVPLGPAYLAGLLEAAGYDVEVVDGIGEGLFSIRTSGDGRLKYQGLTTEQIIRRIGPETRVLGVSLMFSQGWPEYREMIRAIKQAYPELVIVLGGEHPSALPEYVLRDCPEVDYVVAGEGELTLLELVWRRLGNLDVAGLPGVACLDERDDFVHGGPPRRIADFANLPRPAWHLCEIDSFFAGSWTHGIPYGRNMLILATRGCPYQCTFCSNPFMWSTRYMMRPPADVVDEIEWLIGTYGANSIDFEDLTAIVKKEWTLEFCNEMKRRKLDVVWQLPSGTRSEALDTDTLQALYDTGCRLITYAPESGSEASLEIIKKRVKLDRLTASLRDALRIGHTGKINLVIGFPHESRRDCWRTIAYAAKVALLGAHDCLISVFTPYPGTELFEELRRDGTIPNLDDGYFEDLLLQFDATVNTSYCRGVGGRELAYYRIFGMSLFYLISFARSPRRGLRVFGALFSKHFQPRTVLEQKLMEMAARWRVGRRKDLDTLPADLQDHSPSARPV